MQPVRAFRQYRGLTQQALAQSAQVLQVLALLGNQTLPPADVPQKYPTAEQLALIRRLDPHDYRAAAIKGNPSGIRSA